MASGQNVLALLGLGGAADKIGYFNGAGSMALTSFTAAGRALVDDANAAAQRVTMGVELSVDVQAYDIALADLANLGQVGANSQFLVGTGAGALAWEAGSTALDSLGLGTSDAPHFGSVELGHATDTTLARVSSGVVSVEGDTVLMASADIGTTIQAFDAHLLDLAALSPASGAGEFMVSTGAGAWGLQSGTTLRNSMGLGTADDVEHRNLDLAGSLTVTGTKTIIGGEFTATASNYTFLNDAYRTAVAQGVGFVMNYLPTATADTTSGAGVFTPGVDGVSDPTITTAGSGTFAVTDIVMAHKIDGSNVGYFEVFTHIGTTLTLKSTANGVTNQVEDWTTNQVTSETNTGYTLTKVTVTVLRTGTDGNVEVGTGSQTGITYNDLLTVASGGTAIALGGSTAPANGSGAAFSWTNHDHGVEPATANDDWGSVTKPWAIHTRQTVWDGVGTAKTAASYTITGVEGVMAGNSSSNNVVFALPDVATNRGLLIPIIAEGSANLTQLSPSGSDTLLGVGTDYDMAPGTNLFLLAPHYGVDWRIL